MSLQTKGLETVKCGVIQINAFQGEKEVKGHWQCLTSPHSIK